MAIPKYGSTNPPGVLVHFDPGERDRLSSYVERLPPRLGRVTVTFWDYYKIEEVSAEPIIRDLTSKSSQPPKLIPVSLESFPSIDKINSLALGRFSKLEKSGQRTAFVREIAYALRESAERELKIQIGTIPRQILFLIHFFVKVMRNPPHVSWELIEPSAHIGVRSKVGQKLITRGTNDRKGRRYLMFFESPNLRLKAANLEQAVREGQECICAVRDSLMKEVGDEWVRSKLREVAPDAAVRELALSVYADNDMRNLQKFIQRANPDTIFVSGDKKECLACFEYFMQLFKNDLPTPRLILCHVYSPVYSQGSRENNVLIQKSPGRR